MYDLKVIAKLEYYKFPFRKSGERCCGREERMVILHSGGKNKNKRGDDGRESMHINCRKITV